jgi:ankyrin repeat protein
MLVPFPVPVSRRRFRRVLVSSVVAVALLCLVWFLYPIIRYQIGPNHALQQGIESGDVSAVKAALDRGANVDGRPESEEFEGVSPLGAAAGDGKIELVRLLLDRGANVNMRDGWACLPLIYAAENDKIDVVELLISRGARVNDGERGSYALWRAAVEGKAAAVRVLLAHGANPNTHLGDEPPNTVLGAAEYFHRSEVAGIRKMAGAQ